MRNSVALREWSVVWSSIAEIPSCPPPVSKSFTFIVKQEKHCKYKCKVEARSRNHYCRGKILSTKHPTFKRMRRVMMPSVTCPAVLYFSTLSHKSHDFPKKKREAIQYKMFVLIFSGAWGSVVVKALRY